MTYRLCKECDADISTRHHNALFCNTGCRKMYERKEKSAKIYLSNPSAIQCRCCKLFVDKGLITHLANLHNLSAVKYRALYGQDALIISESTSQKLSEKIKGDKNNWFNHGGKLSRFSKNHILYCGLSEEEKETRISEFANLIEFDPTKRSNNIQYYLALGMSEDDAAVALSERQTTFSLEKCIQKLGPEEGLKRWQQRQEKWHKNFKKTNYSQISQKLFKQLVSVAPNAIFAECLDNGINNEYVFKTTSGSVYKLDFYVVESKKIIEFDGTYWHDQRQKENKAPVDDQVRDERIAKTDPELKILHVKELDFKQKPNETIEMCKRFLES